MHAPVLAWCIGVCAYVCMLGMCTNFVLTLTVSEGLCARARACVETTKRSASAVRLCDLDQHDAHNTRGRTVGLSSTSQKALSLLAQTSVRARSYLKRFHKHPKYTMMWGQLGGAMRAAVSASPLAAAAAATTFIAPLALRSPSSAGMCVCVLRWS